MAKPTLSVHFPCIALYMKLHGMSEGILRIQDTLYTLFVLRASFLHCVSLQHCAPLQDMMPYKPRPVLSPSLFDGPPQDTPEAPSADRPETKRIKTGLYILQESLSENRTCYVHTILQRLRSQKRSFPTVYNILN